MLMFYLEKQSMQEYWSYSIRFHLSTIGGPGWAIVVVPLNTTLIIRGAVFLLKG